MMLACLVAASLPSFTLVFCGDIMLNGIPVGSKPLAAIRPILQSGNATFANLEIPLTDATGRTLGKSADELKNKTQFILKADPRHAGHLRDVGLDVLSL